MKPETEGLIEIYGNWQKYHKLVSSIPNKIDTSQKTYPTRNCYVLLLEDFVE